MRQTLACIALIAVLAAVVAQTEAIPRLELHMLDIQKFPRAICNDGSPSGFYYQAATTNTNRWILHLEGGWWCWDDATCMGRAASSPGMVSSKTWPATRSPGGIFNVNANDFPDWAGVNLVYMPYCTSDAWVGDGDGLVNKTSWPFRGRSVVDAVFQTLFTGIKGNTPQEVLFSGCSAGGQGLLYNVDGAKKIVSDLTPPGLRFKGFADSGWMMNMASTPNPASPIHVQFQKGWMLWQPRESDCAIANAADPHYCLFSPNAIGYITTPTFIQSSSYDSFQIPYDCCNVPFKTPGDSAQAAGIAHASRTAMRHLIHAPNFMYSSTCFAHCLSEGRQFTSTMVQNTSLATSLTNWFFDRTPNALPLIDNCGFSCSTSCN